MFRLSSWMHLRIPFSYFLLPVFLFSLCISSNFSGSGIAWVFLIVHFFLYPASNAYNSYFDKDEESIALLKNPPAVHRGLYYLALLFDLVAIILSAVKINLIFAVMITVYGLVSKAYSHPAIRLKKYAITSWIITGIFQGLFTFAMCYVGLNDFGLGNILKIKVILPGLLTSMMLWANYPMTQIYQHEEDTRRGDNTLSIILGIRGTFYFSAAFFFLTSIGFVFYLKEFFRSSYAMVFLAAMTPIIIYFLYWFGLVWKNENQANYQKTMLMNFISATCMNGFFVYLFLSTSHIVQAITGGS